MSFTMPPGAPLPTRYRRRLTVVLVVSGVLWVGALVGAVAVPLAVTVRDPLSVLGIQILLWWIAALFLLGQGIALVVAVLAYRQGTEEAPRFARLAVGVPALSALLGVIALVVASLRMG